MDDLVKRSDAVHAIHERIKQIGKDKDPYVLSIRQSVREIPAVDAVELVRCGECRWWDQKEGSRYGYCYACRHKFFSSNWEISILRTYREDFFCADGERKGGGNDG